MSSPLNCYMTCRTCRGTGVELYYFDTSDDSSAVAGDCPKCDGSGEANGPPTSQADDVRVREQGTIADTPPGSHAVHVGAPVYTRGEWESFNHLDDTERDPYPHLSIGDVIRNVGTSGPEYVVTEIHALLSGTRPRTLRCKAKGQRGREISVINVANYERRKGLL